METKKTQSTRDLYYSSPNRGAEKKINLSTTIISCFITLAIGVLIGFNLESVSNTLQGKSYSNISFDSLNEVYETLVENYDGEVKKEDIIAGAKKGLVDAVGDPYSYYMTAAEYQKFTDDLNGNVGAGIGVEIGLRDGYTKVLRTTPDNPARRAGILAGDIIYKVDDENVLDLSVEEVANKMRGEEGTQVKITVVRGNDEYSYDIIREVINDESVYVDYRGDTAILTISRFDQQTGDLAQKFAAEIKSKGCNKVILDLRGNGGGYVDTAVTTASLWIDGGSVTSAKSSTNQHYNKDYTAKTGQATLKDIKTIVLTNGSTASAAEILAGALRDHGKATLVGETTYGKGCMQSLETLSDGSVLRVTIANWYTPNGDNISKGGLEPDEVVERSYEQINKEIDPQLDRALEM